MRGPRRQQTGRHLDHLHTSRLHCRCGISGLVGVGRLFIGRRELFEGVDVEPVDDSGAGHTVVYYGWDRRVTGRLLFGDRIRAEARELVKQLHAAGIVVSGDAVAATNWASREIYAREFRAEVLPGGKTEIVEGLQKQGLTVAMIGDGINDAPALAQANLGIAMGGGTDLAMKAAAIVLMKNDLGRFLELLALSRRTLRVIRQNLFWSFGYNSIGLVFAAFGLLNPILASSAMVVSSVCVTVNALRLGRTPRTGYP
jgi:P-type Cu+ transporter